MGSSAINKIIDLVIAIVIIKLGIDFVKSGHLNQIFDELKNLNLTGAPVQGQGQPEQPEQQQGGQQNQNNDNDDNDDDDDDEDSNYSRRVSFFVGTY